MNLYRLATCLVFLLHITSYSQTVIRWDLENLNTVGSNTTTVLGSPVLIETNLGKVIQFDGVDDGIQLNNDPLSSATEFTVEVIFKPYSGGNLEQRYLHMEQDDNNRMLMELRYADGKWWLDTFIKSGSSSKTLIDATKTHSTDIWYHAALVYKAGVMKHFVSGIEELSGNVTYVPVTSGKTSIGVRLNKVNYFKGAIRTIKVTHKALIPSEFIASEAVSLNTVTSNEEDLSTEGSAEIKIFPNPVLTSATVQLSTLVEDAQISLHNALGEEMEVTQHVTGRRSIDIERRNLVPGIYYLTIATEGKVYTQPLIFAIP